MSMIKNSSLNTKYLYTKDVSHPLTIYTACSITEYTWVVITHVAAIIGWMEQSLPHTERSHKASVSHSLVGHNPESFRLHTCNVSESPLWIFTCSLCFLAQGQCCSDWWGLTPSDIATASQSSALTSSGSRKVRNNNWLNLPIYY